MTLPRRLVRAIGLLGAAAAVLLAASGVRPAVSAGASADSVRIEVLSNRADLVSGGTALAAVDLPAGTASDRVRVDVGGRDVTRDFAIRPDGRFEGLIGGLNVGPNLVTARLPDGSGARITITNHPVGGPVFSGPQIQPWVCGTQAAGLGPPRDAQCNAPTSFTYMYKSSASGQFAPYDPSHPPGDVASTTTDQGVTVPFIVRVEEGTQDRGLYQLAVLFTPGQPWAPWAPQRAWNHKLVVPFGASTAPHHSQDPPTSVLGATADDNALGYALSRGFMVADSGLNIQGSDANANVSAEALLMLKEHIAGTYGSIRYTIGNGCSGGGLQQYMIAAMYPGLLNGIQPNCSFTDMWSTAPDVGECHGLINYFQNNPSQPWVPAIDGHRDPSDCEAWNATFWPVINPSNAANCNLPQSEVYDPNTNPRGTRCTLQDYQINIWGRRPPSMWGPVEKRIGEGFAERPFDNVGVQYGLKALQAGLITPAEFADLNAKVGGADIDGNMEPARDVMDYQTAATAYRTGQITDARQLASVPIIDLRAYSETAEIHTSFYSYKMRARLDQANGGHANQIIWTFPSFSPIVGVVPPPDIAVKSFQLMDRWLSAIEADTSTAPLSQKVIRAKPSDAIDACFPENASAEVTDSAACARVFPYYGNTRTASGAPMADDIIKCQLKPLQAKDYPVSFTPAQWGQLQQAFPTGVCDYSKPGVAQQPSIPWISFADGPGGRPLGPAPESTAFGPNGSSVNRCVDTRGFSFRIHRPGGHRVIRVTAYVNGHRVSISRARAGHGIRRVVLRRLPQGQFTVRIVVRAAHHRRVVTVRRYVGCSKGAPRTLRPRSRGHRRR